MFWIFVALAALAFCYGITVVERTGLGQQRTFTSPDLLTGFYLVALVSILANAYQAMHASPYEKIVATSAAVLIAATLSLFLTMHLLGYIETWPYFYWLEHGLVK
jgi:hypothetical protein